jgi:hypothetical protein
MIKTTLSIIIFFIATLTFAQENTANHWFFGEYCGVDFSHGVPYGITGGQITGWEGCATVGNIQGNLLFYTDGQVVYNKNHEIMENGTGLMGHWSSVQSSIIVKKPGSDNLYYIFTTDDGAEQHLENGWRYSIVDITLDGGLGAVTETKNVLLEELVTEKQIAIMHSNNISVWIIAHKWNSNEFVAYEITLGGINPTPVVSAIGTVHEGGYSPNPLYNDWTNACGFMKTNQDGNKIALAIHIMGIFELFDFNKSTGILSNCRTSPTNTTAYGVEFSPDGNKLYATVDIYTMSKLYQYDISQTEPFLNPSIIALEGTNQNRGIQLGPNGKIYATKYLGGYLAEINYPNETGSACGYESNAIYLESEICHAGLPSLFYYKGFEFFTGSEVNVEICDGDSIFLQNAYQSDEGTYYDTIDSYLGWDSIINTHLTVLPSPEIPVIYEDAGILHSSYATNYQWYRNSLPIVGATSQVYQPFILGSYMVEVFEDFGCHVFSEELEFTYNLANINSANSNLIYPNPFETSFYVDKNKEYSMRIYDLNGKESYSRNNLNGISKHNCSFLEKGFYIVKIQTKDKTLFSKIVKK